MPRFRMIGLAGMYLVGMAAFMLPQSAAADCSRTYCATDYCEFQCSGSREYLVFGKRSSTGRTGVCWFGFSGSWGQGSLGGCIWDDDGSGNHVDAADWRVKAGGGDDLVRLASPSGESCGTGCTIDGDIDAGDTFMFWGDADDDRLYLCATTGTPSSTYCVTNVGRADGRADEDLVVGSIYGEYLWGGGSTYGDSLYGYGGDDVIVGGNVSNASYYDYIDGGTGDDSIAGGNGGDVIYGGYGSDTIYGLAGCDLIDAGEDPGGGETDRCYCRYGEDPDYTGQTSGCEEESECAGICFGE